MPAQEFLQSKGQLDSGTQLAENRLFCVSLVGLSFVSLFKL